MSVFDKNPALGANFKACFAYYCTGFGAYGKILGISTVRDVPFFLAERLFNDNS